MTNFHWVKSSPFSLNILFHFEIFNIMKVQFIFLYGQVQVHYRILLKRVFIMPIIYFKIIELGVN